MTLPFRLLVMRERLRAWSRIPGYLRDDLRREAPVRRPLAVRLLRLLASFVVQTIALVPITYAMFLFGKHLRVLLSVPVEMRDQPTPDGPYALGLGLVALGLTLSLLGRRFVSPTSRTPLDDGSGTVDERQTPS